MTAESTTEVRRARRPDLDVLLELVEEFYGADGQAFDPENSRAGLEPLLADETWNDHGAVWVIADDAGRTDGYIVVTWGWSIEIGGPEAVLDELYVRTRGAGKGSRVIEVAEQACRDRGIRQIFLETDPINEGARRLYARHGYADDDSIWVSKELT